MCVLNVPICSAGFHGSLAIYESAQFQDNENIIFTTPAAQKHITLWYIVM